MSPGVFNVGESGELVEMSAQPYESEAVLQELLARYPNLLAGDESSGERPRRWVLVQREAAVSTEADGGGRWWIDHLFLDQDGVPTLVEVKRSTDSRIRREVVGQMLDYAANAVAYWPAERLELAFDATCISRGSTPEDVLSDAFGEDLDHEQFWTAVRTNLHAGRLRLVFVADLIPPELERVVEFLNRNMASVDVVALEVKQFVGGVQKTLVSRLLGQSAATRQTKSMTRGQRQWDEDSFLGHASEVCATEDVETMRDLFEWCRDRSLRFAWGSGSTEGSFFPCLDVGDESYWPYRLRSSGVVEFQFYWMARRDPFADEGIRNQFRLRLNEIDGVEFERTAIARQPSFPIVRIRDAEQRRRFDKAVEWFFATARQANAERAV